MTDQEAPMPEPTMTHEPHCNDRCVHYLAGESVSGVAPDVPHREPVGRNSPSQGGVTDSPAPEPGADATLRLTGIVNIGYSDTDPGDMGEPRVFQSDGEWYVTVPSWAALARPTPALDVLDIRWLLDNSNPMHYQGCDPDGCSCGVSAKYEAIIDRQAVREELAARATEGGTDR